MRILAIDDDPALLEFYEQLLSDDGHEIRLARHGGEGLSILGNWQPDLILVDLEMPVMSGEEFLQRLDADRVRGHTVLVVSGSVSRLRALTGRRATAFLRKPFVFDDLRDFVRKADVTSDESSKHPRSKTGRLGAPPAES